MISDIADSEFYRKRAIECLHENKLKEAIIFIAFSIYYKGEKKNAKTRRKINPATIRNVPASSEQLSKSDGADSEGTVDLRIDRGD